MGGGLDLYLPYNPLQYGMLNIVCTGTITSNGQNIPATQGATTTEVQSLSCPGYLAADGTTWDFEGTLTFNFNTVYATHCSSGRGGHCITGYWWTMMNANGVLRGS
jgi:hypothetical protein